MDSNEALSWLESYTQYGWKFGLDRINILCELLGNPQNDLACIHVGGTNGKGSVCRYLTSILHHAGYTVGTYLSPHLERFNERILINNTEISSEELTQLIIKIKPCVELMKRQNKTPTFFEIVTALAFCYFQEKHVDYVVLEVGLGGRYDATNIAVPLVSVITNISLEHTNILGNSLESIAFEKAGIIKDNVPVVTASDRKAREVIELVAREKKAPLILVHDTQWKRLSSALNNQEFFIHGTLKDYVVRTSLLGEYQGENIALAIHAVEQLQLKGVYLSDNDVIQGISQAVHPGRMEIFSSEPLIVLEGAHNPMGMEMLRKTLQQDFRYENLIVVLGILKDKDIDMMIQSIVPLADLVVLTKSNNPRASEPEHIREKILGKGFNKTIHSTENIPSAIDYALQHAGKKDLICITGSLFTVGEARTYLRGKKMF
ncbi:MAG: folylpolyglutamate synthase/dihydrofolate synthase family protein [Candidatus Thermoplasmatota archaeon]